MRHFQERTHSVHGGIPTRERGNESDSAGTWVFPNAMSIASEGLKRLAAVVRQAQAAEAV
ncbi:hypothetical protein ACYZT7_21945 [Pseudomonas sp. RT4P38]